MVEWFKAAVLKTAEVKASGSSNLPLSAIFWHKCRMKPRGEIILKNQVLATKSKFSINRI